jgi:hypothetical protein
MSGRAALLRVVREWWWTFPLIGVAELIAQVHVSSRAPTVEEWQALLPAVSALHQPGDLVVAAPEWADPLLRQALGPKLMALRDVARPDATRYERAIEVSTLGARAPDLEGFRVVREEEAGPFRLRVLENQKPAHVRFDFVDRLSPGVVTVREVADEERGCPWLVNARVATGGLHGHIAFPPQRFQCAGRDERFVGITVIDDQDYRPRRCVYAHPPDQGYLSLRYDGVPLGDTLYGYAGLSYFTMRDGVGTPVELTVLIDGEVAVRHVHEDERGWQRFAASAGSRAGTTANVEIRVRSERSAQRHFCFHLDTR